MNLPQGTKVSSAAKQWKKVPKRVSKTSATRRGYGTGHWFVGLWAGIALLMLIAGFASGRASSAIEMLVAVSIPLAILWFIIGTRRVEADPSKEEIAVSGQGSSSGQDFIDRGSSYETFPGEGYSYSGHGVTCGNGCGSGGGSSD